jgi:hypothetical protein
MTLMKVVFDKESVNHTNSSEKIDEGGYTKTKKVSSTKPLTKCFKKDYKK